MNGLSTFVLIEGSAPVILKRSCCISGEMRNCAKSAASVGWLVYALTNIARVPLNEADGVLSPGSDGSAATPKSIPASVNGLTFQSPVICIAAVPAWNAASQVEVPRSAAGTSSALRSDWKNFIPFTEASLLMFVLVVSDPEAPKRRFHSDVVNTIVSSQSPTYMINPYLPVLAALNFFAQSASPSQVVGTSLSLIRALL